jgi:hypothetical protein
MLKARLFAMEFFKISKEFGENLVELSLVLRRPEAIRGVSGDYDNVGTTASIVVTEVFPNDAAKAISIDGSADLFFRSYKANAMGNHMLLVLR